MAGRKPMAGRAVRLPVALVDAVVRLAELSGVPFDVELAANLGAALASGGGGTTILPDEALAPWEAVSLALPAWMREELRTLALRRRRALGAVIAAAVAPVVDERLRVATHALERGLGHAQAASELASQPEDPTAKPRSTRKPGKASTAKSAPRRRRSDRRAG